MFHENVSPRDLYVMTLSVVHYIGRFSCKWLVQQLLGRQENIIALKAAKSDMLFCYIFKKENMYRKFSFSFAGPQEPGGRVLLCQILADNLTLFQSGGWAYYVHHITTQYLLTHPPNPYFGPVMECAICMDLKIADRYPFSNGFTHS